MLNRMSLLITMAAIAACGPIKPSRDAGEAARSSEEAKAKKPSNLLPEKPKTKVQKNTKFSPVVQLFMPMAVAPQKTTYQDVKDIFNRACANCHNSSEEFDFSEFPFKSVLVPDTGDLMQLVLERINSTNPDVRMPFDAETWGPGEALPQTEINKIQNWVNDGLLLETEAAATLDQMADKVIMEYVADEKPMQIILKKDSKSSGLYSTIVEDFPVFIKSLSFKVYKGNVLVDEMNMANFYPKGNPRLSVKIGLR